MGCCQSRVIEKHHDRNRSEALPLPDICYPDKIGYGGVKVLTSSASASGASSASSSGRTYTRLVVGPEWLFAALFEAHGGSGLDGRGGGSDAAARFCAEQCYPEFQRAVEATGSSASGTNDNNMSVILTSTLKALDRRFLTEASITRQDRWASGCTAVLLHITLGARPQATVASLGPCAAVVGQRRGGLASATSAPLVLCGGAANSHDALQGFLAALAAEQQPAPMKPGRTFLKKELKNLFKRPSAKDMPRQFSELPILPGGEPEYNHGLDAPQALGFGCGKGMQLVPSGKAAAAEQRQEARVGMQVKTASHVLGPGDDCLVLLSGGAVASIAPADVALLMHRMGRLAGIPYEAKARPLRPDAARGPVAQLDNLGVAGPPVVTKPATVAAAISPFNAARLLVHQAVANVAARRPRASVGPVGIMAFALEWPRSSDDSGAAAAAIGNSVSAVCAAAASAVTNRQRAQYLWQLLRLYYKVPHKRRTTIISKWHEVFDRVVGEGKRTANLKETAAWLRLGAAVKVSAAGNVQCLSSREDAEQLARTPPRKTSPAPRQNHFSAGGIPSVSPLRGAGGQRLSNRPPLSASGASAHPPSPTSALGGIAIAHRSPSMGSTPGRQRFQSLTPGPAGTPRCSSAREALAAIADAAAVAIISAASPKVDPVVACYAGSQPAAAARPPSHHGPVGLLEAEGIDRQYMSGHKLRGQEATDGGCEAALSPNLIRASQKSFAGSSGAIPVASAAGFAANAPVAASDRTSNASSIAWGPKECGNEEHSIAFLKDLSDGFSTRRSSRGSTSKLAKEEAATAAVVVAASGSSVSQLSPGGMGGYEGEVVGAASAGETTAATAAMTMRIPSRSSGGGSVSSPSAPDSARSPLSRIPTLLLKPGPAGATSAAHATPRLSMPGSGTPVYQPTPASAGVVNAPTANVTPPTRGSNTWGGAAPTTPPPSTAPNSARSGSSRLPRPPNLNIPAAVPSTSPAGSVSNRSLFGGSDAGSIPRSNSARPPRLEVPASSTAAPAAAAGGGDMRHGDDLDLLSPDDDQLAAWALEAVDALGASAKKPSPSVSASASASASPRLQQHPTSARSKSGLSGRTFANGVRSGGVGTPSSGGVRSGMGSRIPLSPRGDYNIVNLSGSSGKLTARTPSRLSVVKPTRASSLNSPEQPKLERTASARSRR
ncbi:hypothetical protein VaNZ11_016066 [Volvox africanus]|uniref:Uncharacterized protein n=1 Tax=Volvox africanus TaxID=51714 RepID=A0ABQ5SMF0_9CHLO|nr:hypothetical protein VaNZ11_016066 [Volvox africanus]